MNRWKLENAALSWIPWNTFIHDIYDRDGYGSVCKHGLTTLIPKCSVKCRIKSFVNSKTSTAAQLEFSNEWVISPITLEWTWLLIHAGVQSFYQYTGSQLMWFSAANVNIFDTNIQYSTITSAPRKKYLKWKHNDKGWNFRSGSKIRLMLINKHCCSYF